MADFFKTNFKAQTPGEEPLQSIFDLLTPEEKVQYSKNFQPTTKERVFTGLGGVADVISSAGGGRNDHYYGEGMQKRSDSRIGQDMQFVGNELTRKYAERQAKAAAEKASQESAGVGEELGSIYDPQYFDNTNVGSEGKFKVAEHLKYLKGLQNQKDVQAMKSAPRGPAPKDMSYWWTAQRKGALSDERVKPFLKQGVGMKQAQQLLDSVKNGNTVAFAGLGIKMAKAMGEVGVMTDQDISRYVNSKKLSQSAADKLRGWTQGRPSEASEKEIQEIISVLGDTYQKDVLPVYNEWIDSADAISRGRGDRISRQDVASRLALDGTTVEADSQEPQIPEGFVKGTDNGEEGYIGPDGLFYTMEEMSK